MTTEQAISIIEYGLSSCASRNQDEALDMALSALRKEQERQKGCRYCQESYHLLNGEFDTRVFIRGNHLILRGDGWESKTVINECPNCGRELKGDDK